MTDLSPFTHQRQCSPVWATGLMANKNGKRKFGYKIQDVQVTATLLPVTSNNLPGLLFLYVIKHLFCSTSRIERTWDMHFDKTHPSSREAEHMSDTTCGVDKKGFADDSYNKAKHGESSRYPGYET